MKNVLIVSALPQEIAFISDYLKDRKDWGEIGANRKKIGIFSKNHEPSEEEKKLREKVFRIPAQLVIDYLE